MKPRRNSQDLLGLKLLVVDPRLGLLSQSMAHCFDTSIGAISSHCTQSTFGRAPISRLDPSGRKHGCTSRGRKCFGDVSFGIPLFQMTGPRKQDHPLPVLSGPKLPAFMSGAARGPDLFRGRLRAAEAAGSLGAPSLEWPRELRDRPCNRMADPVSNPSSKTRLVTGDVFPPPPPPKSLRVV